jgi:hypothetical protein
LDTSLKIADKPLDACGVEAVTYISSALKPITGRTPYCTVATAN